MLGVGTEPACKYHFPLVELLYIEHSLVSLPGHDAMCGMQADLGAIVMYRATAGLLLPLDGPADLLWRESVCVAAVQSVNDKEENDVMGGEKKWQPQEMRRGNEELTEMTESSGQQ